MKTKNSIKTKIVQNYQIGDFVEIDGDETALTEDQFFLNTLVGKKLQIVGVKLEKKGFDVSYTCSDANGLIVKQDAKVFYFVDADLRRYKSKTTAIEDIIKTHICEDIFQNGYPTDLDNLHPYDFFMRADVDCTDDVSMSPLGTEWGYEVCQAYELDNIRAIRGLMQSMYSDLERLKSSLFQYVVKSTMVSLSDFIEPDTFYEFVQKTNATLHRQGTADEYAMVHAVDTKVVL